MVKYAVTIQIRRKGSANEEHCGCCDCGGLRGDGECLHRLHLEQSALKGLGGGETPLMDWGPSFGFKKSVFKDGTMPEKGVELVWSDDDYTAGGVTYPCRLGAKIGKGMILIIR